jgi:hypothetical protein
MHTDVADGCQCLSVAVPESHKEENESQPC